MLPHGTLRFISRLGCGKSGISWLARYGSQEVVYKQIHDEPCAFYSFNGDKTRLEARDYLRLVDAGIPVPNLLAVDHERGFLVKEYIHGVTADLMITEGLPSTAVLAQLFAIARRCRKNGWNIDYFPTNFVISHGTLYYIDYEVNPYDAAWSLEEWGLYYWANPAGMRVLHRTGSAALLNTAPDSGIPIRSPFRALVGSWIQEFGRP